MDEPKQKVKRATNLDVEEAPDNAHEDTEMKNIDDGSSDEEPEDAEDAKMNNKFQVHDDQESEEVEQSEEEDYVTSNGSFEPLSRKGMASRASPFQPMSFESSLTFLKEAAVQEKQDQLQNPSSCLMVGKPCNTGTGSFTLLQKLQV